jgi:hypothetical protein
LLRPTPSMRFLLALLLIAAFVIVCTRVPFLRPVRDALQLAVALLFVIAAVRVGLAVAIAGFGLATWSIAIPIALGLAAWLIRPKWSSSS